MIKALCYYSALAPVWYRDSGLIFKFPLESVQPPPPRSKKLFFRKNCLKVFSLYTDWMCVCQWLLFIYTFRTMTDLMFFTKRFPHLSHNPILFLFLFSDLQMWHSVWLSPESECVTGVLADVAGFGVAASLVGSVGFKSCLIASHKFFLTDKLFNISNKRSLINSSSKFNKNFRVTCCRPQGPQLQLPTMWIRYLWGYSWIYLRFRFLPPMGAGPQRAPHRKHHPRFFLLTWNSFQIDLFFFRK